MMNDTQTLDDVLTGWQAMNKYSLEIVAQNLEMDVTTLEAAIQQTIATLSQQRYYHYMTRNQSEVEAAEQSSGVKRPRHIVLFRNPDEALSFAQKIRFSHVPRVRAINAQDVMLHLLGDEQIARVIFFEREISQLPNGLNLDSLDTIAGACSFERHDVLAHR